MMKIEYATYTNVGKREINEDAVKAVNIEDKYCFVLCDGLGGHGMGDVASSLVTNSFEQSFAETDKVKYFLKNAFVNAQNELLEEQKRRGAADKMKTTAVALAIDKKKAYIGHIGDSRLYIFYKNKIVKRTLDHSIPQMLVLTKDIKESEIRNHPQRNIVLRVLGNEWEEEMFELMSPLSLRKEQAFLLCSDGFWELIDEELMCEILMCAQTPEEWLKGMSDIVNTNGRNINMDNNSAIAVWISK